MYDNELSKLYDYLLTHDYKAKVSTGLINRISVYDDKENRLWYAQLNTDWDFGVPDEFYGSLELNGFINGKGINQKFLTASEVIEILEGNTAAAGEKAIGPRIVIIGVGKFGCGAIENDLDQDIPNWSVWDEPARLEPASQINMYRIDTDKRMTVGPGGLLIGSNYAHGKGTRGKTTIGEKAARDHKKDIQRLIIGAGMVIIIAGTNGGTSTGAAPVIAEISTDMDIPTFAVLYEPFGCVGQKRMDIANKTIETLSNIADGITIIPSEKDDSILRDVQRIIDKYYYD